MSDPSAFPPSSRLLLWHATPLHYLPHLLATGALLSQDRLHARGLPIRPRPTAAARVRKLGLSDFVHLSLAPKTPLLADKRARGYPHALLTFDRASVFSIPGAGLLKYNTKSWRHRDDFVPVCDPAEREALLQEHEAGKYPSMEALVPGTLPLAPYGVGLHFASEEEREWFAGLLAAGLTTLAEGLRPTVSPDQFPPGQPLDLTALAEYARACLAAHALLPPPELPFD